MSDPIRVFLEFPLSAGQAWIARVQEVAAPHVLRLGHVEHPDKLVLICELQPEARPALMEDLQAAWRAFQDDLDEDDQEA